MRRITAAALLLLSFSVGNRLFAATVDTQQQVDLANLPDNLKDSTLFRFMRERNIEGLPSPLVNLSWELKYVGFSPVGINVARGRSLQNINSTEQKPRKLLISYSNTKVPLRSPIGFEDYSNLEGSDYEGRLYFGLSLANDQLEILSWNPKYRVYDMLIAPDYLKVGPAGIATRLIEQANFDRQNCLVCHQHGGPISSPPPWNEMVTHDPYRTFSGYDQRIKDFLTPPTLYNDDGILLTKELTPESNNAAYAVGIQALGGSRLMQAALVVRDLCGFDLECRRYILIAAMTNPNQSKFIRQSVALSDPTDIFSTSITVPFDRLKESSIPSYFFQKKRIQRLEKLWPASDFSFINEGFPDLSNVASGSADFIDADPRTSRTSLDRGVPVSLAPQYIFDIAFEGLGFLLSDSRELKKYNADLRSRLFMGSKFVSSETEAEVMNLISDQQWPPDPKELMSFIKKHLIKGETQVSSQSLPIASEPTMSSSETSFFTRYCARCHQGSDSIKDLPLFNMTDLRKWNVENDYAVDSLISSRQMPPPGRNDLAYPTDSEITSTLSLISETAEEALSDNGALDFSIGHLGVRIAGRPSDRLSHILPNAGVALEPPYYMNPCTLETSSQPGEARYLASNGSDGQTYLALENFPQYQPGNIIQIFVLESEDSSSCMVAGLMRNGRMIYLSYDRELRRQVAKTFSSNDPSINIFHVSEPYHIEFNPRAGNSDDRYVLARDGEIYQLTVQGGVNPILDLQKIPVQNRSDFIWQRIGHGARLGEIYLESVEGEWLRANKSEQKIVLQSNPGYSPVINASGRVEDYEKPAFAPNLLDRSSVLAIPKSYYPKIKLTEGQSSRRTQLRINRGIQKSYGSGSIEILPGMSIALQQNGAVEGTSTIVAKNLDDGRYRMVLNLKSHSENGQQADIQLVSESFERETLSVIKWTGYISGDLSSRDSINISQLRIELMQ